MSAGRILYDSEAKKEYLQEFRERRDAFLDEIIHNVADSLIEHGVDNSELEEFVIPRLKDVFTELVEN